MGRARDFGMGLGIGAGIVGLAMAIAGPATAGPAATASAARALAAAALSQTIPPPCPGDINGDHVVNAADFTILASNFGSLCTNVDYDLDGQSPDDGDCDDTNPTIYLGAPEICDGLDNDCNGQVDDGIDTSSDPQNCGGCGLVCALPNTTFSICSGGVCMIGACSPGYLDVDNLAFNGCETAVGDFDADFDGWTPNQGDCDDGNPNINPGAQDICDGIDNNCNGQVDDGINFNTDPQNCGGCGNVCPTPPNVAFSVCSGAACMIGACTAGFLDIDQVFINGCETAVGDYDADFDGWTPNQGDCNDADFNINPGVPEICNNGIDDDCDGATDGADTECP